MRHFRLWILHTFLVGCLWPGSVFGEGTATSTAIQTEPQPPPWKPYNLYSLLYADDLVADLEQRHLAGGRFHRLLERVTRGMVAAPYLLSPLGEDAMPDPDPRFRLDAFDCTTFVETALALALCDDLDAVKKMLDQIRYKKGKIAFNKRRHLMTSQWIPGLVDAGYFEDVTKQVGGKATKWIELKLTQKRWRKRRIAKSLELPKEEVPVGTHKLPFLTTAWVEKHTKKVPLGIVINIVRQDVRSTPDVITHQGIVLARRGQRFRMVRHASPVSKRVIDESLTRMMKRYQKPGRKWPIIGVNLLRIVDPRKKHHSAGSEQARIGSPDRR